MFGLINKSLYVTKSILISDISDKRYKSTGLLHLERVLQYEDLID